MLERWLGDLTLPAFLEEYWLRAPYSRPDAARDAAPLATWDTLGRLVAEAHPDALVVRNGRLLAGSAPRTRSELRALLALGCSVVLRHTERHDAALDELARSFAATLGGAVAIQMYATPGGFHSFGWHYDAEEVFIVQTAGVKDYYLRANTVHPSPLIDAMPRDMQLERETSPFMECRLVPGDWLYVPAGYWHMARARAPSLSLSIGVLPATALDALDRVRPQLRELALWRSRVPATPARRAALASALTQSLAAILSDEWLEGGERENEASALAPPPRQGAKCEGPGPDQPHAT